MCVLQVNEVIFMLYVYAICCCHAFDMAYSDSSTSDAYVATSGCAVFDTKKSIANELLYQIWYDIVSTLYNL